MTTIGRQYAALKISSTWRVGERLASVDGVRGLVMVLMALDHVREFWYRIAFSPTDLSHTTAALFMTRWITHFCAPLFVFLAGTGAFLSLTRGKSKQELAWYLFTRGCLLIVLEMFYISTLVGVWLHFPGTGFFLLNILWALGCSMIALAALIWLPDYLILLFGVLTVAGHNLLDPVQIAAPWGWHFLWSMLHAPEMFTLPSGVTVMFAYPLLPWVGVMALGYVFGQLLLYERPARYRAIVRLGLALTAAFIVIRAVNIYGDPHAWTAQPTAVFTVLSFLNCEKYPPSLLYLLMTLGPGIWLLGALEKRLPFLWQPLLVFGRVPLFYFLVHFPYIMVLYVIVEAARRSAALARFLPAVPTEELAVIYAVWLFVVLSLYPVCRWYARLKRNKPWRWLKYI